MQRNQTQLYFPLAATGNNTVARKTESRMEVVLARVVQLMET
jgi:hypothetical protein